MLDPGFLKEGKIGQEAIFQNLSWVLGIAGNDFTTCFPLGRGGIC